MFNELNLHWLAGVFDAGCHISIGETTRQSRVSFEATSADRGLLQHIRSIVGAGGIYRRPGDKRGRRKPLYRWQLRGKPAIELLGELEPLLVGRRHRGKIAAAELSLSNRKIKQRR